MKYLIAAFAALILTISCSEQKSDPTILVFSKTEGFRHESIEAGVDAIKKLGAENGFKVDHSEDAAIMTEDSLIRYDVIVFLNTTQDILNEEQQYEFKRFYQAGGGFVGIHAAADTEYDWPWYGELIGGYFNGHPNNPNVRNADIQVVDAGHPSCQHLPETWNRDDEWYNYKNLHPDMKVLLNLDESSYEGGTNGDSHPIAWTRDHMFYTGLGHTEETFMEENFLKHLLGGIQSVMGDGPDYTADGVAPSLNRFQKVVYEQNLNEPMELVVLPNDDIIFIQRKGDIKYYSKEDRITKTINEINVHTEFEDGLLGIALDPKFEQNAWVYLFYSPNIEEAVQHVSRFKFEEGKLNLETEQIIIKIPVQREECCHSGGALEFDSKGNLLIGVGDDTNPHESSGYAPIDGRLGRQPFDARRSSSNTNDLRGGILRITPQDDGTYTIPEGNLFPASDSTKAEIYVMGCRNPYRFFVDPKTDFLYWGDVGPDAGEDRERRGPKGHDEVNQARKAGYFGWPLFVADNKAYHQYDFEKDLSGDEYNPMMPVNRSPNNDGKLVLPPANNAFIYYPYGESEVFPLVGTGGRNAMAGFVYHYDDYPASDHKLPRYYDGKLFIYDWMRGWFMAVTMDDEGNYVSMERFLPNHKFSNPTDIVVDDDGRIYMLEYGTAWFSKNVDARLVEIKFSGGNRPPVPEVKFEKTIGAAPMVAEFDASSTIDFDGDEIEYTWKINNKKVGSGPILKYTFENPGIYVVRLEASDDDGGMDFHEVQMMVGNDKPEVAIEIEGNSSFYFGQEPINYVVRVNDTEDGSIGNGIDPSAVAVSFDYLETGFDRNEIALGHMSQVASHPGMKAMKNSDCYTCHKKGDQSVGPTFIEIANKYREQDDAMAYLSERIIKGGGGVWGDQAMAAHPQLSGNEVAIMVEYILDLEEKMDEDVLPPEGQVIPEVPSNKEPGGVFIMNATYVDKGTPKVAPISTTETKMLRSSELLAIDYDEIKDAMKMDLEPGTIPGIEEKTSILIGNHNSYIMYRNIDFNQIKQVTSYATVNPDYMAGGTLELILDDIDNEAIGSAEPEAIRSLRPSENTMNVENIDGIHDLYVKFVSKDPAKPAMVLSHLKFEK
ncbi:ThuA domain-containing protein [Portibacter marinus]|uniref:ThuA domain-containing protein n=1 Tax=Portibacter marinus TaxID=2898660 RepID=UPI001F16D222|nr:ThuA domain-containing protein [Portibacter marinus]